MERQRTPQQKKALDYTHQRMAHKGGFVNNNKSSRRAARRGKARTHRTYRRATHGLMTSETTNERDGDGTVLHTLPVRLRHFDNWGKGEPLGVWLAQSNKMRAYVRLNALLRDDQTIDDGTRLTAFVAELPRAGSPLAGALARALRLILSGPWPNNQWGWQTSAAESDLDSPNAWHPLTSQARYVARLRTLLREDADAGERLQEWMRASGAPLALYY